MGWPTGLENAGKFPFDAGQYGVEFAAQLGDDLGGGTLALGLEFDQKIAGIGFRNGQRKTRPGASRIAFNFRGGLEHFLRLEQLAVGFRQTGAPGRDVIEHEAAFVHFGQKVAFQMRVKKDAQGHQGKAGGEGDPCVPEGLADAHFVNPDGQTQDRTRFAVLRSVTMDEFLAAAHEPRGQGRSQRDGQGQGCQQGHDHGQSQRAKKHTGD